MLVLGYCGYAYQEQYPKVDLNESLTSRVRTGTWLQDQETERVILWLHKYTSCAKQILKVEASSDIPENQESHERFLPYPTEAPVARTITGSRAFQPLALLQYHSNP